MHLIMSKNVAQNVFSSQGIINYPTQLHLVGHFCILYHDAQKHEYQVCIGLELFLNMFWAIFLLIFRSI